jgi:HAD superfamily hydrolase (TIGR01509 family)
MAIDALVFDFDGLILDTEWSDYLSVRRAFQAHGAELPIEEWRLGVGTTDKRHWTEWLEEVLGHPIDRDTVRAERLEEHHRLIAGEFPLPGVVRLLDEAEAAGVPVAVASSSPLDWVGGHLRRIGLWSRFDLVVTREDVEQTKPAPDLYRLAVAELGVRAECAVALEDSEHGCTAAVAAGLACVAVPNRITRPQSFDHADLVVDSLAGVTLADLGGLTVARRGGSCSPAADP